MQIYIIQNGTSQNENDEMALGVTLDKFTLDEITFDEITLHEI